MRICLIFSNPFVFASASVFSVRVAEDFSTTFIFDLDVDEGM